MRICGTGFIGIRLLAASIESDERGTLGEEQGLLRDQEHPTGEPQIFPLSRQWKMRYLQSDGDLRATCARFEFGEGPAQVDRARQCLAGAQCLVSQVSGRPVTIGQCSGLPAGRGIRPNAQ